MEIIDAQDVADRTVTKRPYYNRTNTCDRCGNKLISPRIYREYDKRDNWTGKWLCYTCWQIDYRKKNGSPYLADYKINNLDPNCKKGIGLIFEQVTCKARGIKNLNIENNNFNSPFDHSVDPELGILETKGTVLKHKILPDRIKEYDCWNFTIRLEKIFDHIILYCADKNMENIERVYIIPWKDIDKRFKNMTFSITICKDLNGWYEKYRVDEKPYNNAFHNLDETDLKILRKRKKDKKE